MKKPEIRCKRIYLIDIEKLTEMGVKLILADMDNTLAYWRTDKTEPQAAQWIKNAVACGIDVLLFSNSKGKNVTAVGEKLGIPVFRDAKKPFVKKAVALIKNRGLRPENVLIAGDQLFTDLLLADRIGAKCALLEPMSDREWWFTKVFNRTRERLVWKKLFNEKYFR